MGIDVSETRVRVELFDLAMAGHARADYPLDPGEHEVTLIAQTILTGLEAVLAGSGVDPATVLGIGVAIPGIVEDGPDGLVHGQAFGWESVPLGRLLRSGTRLPLYIDNGVKAMGQAEMWFGAGRGAQSVVACLIGSGVGASIIANGVALRGVTSSAGEWGHSTVVVDGRPCRCGSLGCLEAYVGAEAILDQYGSRLPGADQEAELAALIDLAPTSARAADILDTTALYLGLSIADLINMFNPERIILGGWAGLLLGEHMMPAIRAAAGQGSLRHLFAQTSIGLGHLGPDAVALGAAALPIKALLSGDAFPASPPARRGAARAG